MLVRSYYLEYAAEGEKDAAVCGRQVVGLAGVVGGLAGDEAHLRQIGLAGLAVIARVTTSHRLA